MNIPDQVLILEGSLAVGFLLLLVFVRKKGGKGDGPLWGLVWCTRLLASLNGAKRFPALSPELAMYMSLQALSGFSLMLILMRSELQVVRERLLRRLAVRLSKTSGGGGLEEPTRLPVEKRST